MLAGEMDEQLARSMGPIQFSDLKAHLARGAVIEVATSIDLLEVGRAIARDEKARVAAWLERGELGKPSFETINRWSKLPPSSWVALVVQPFVLVRVATEPPRPDT